MHKKQVVLTVDAKQMILMLKKYGRVGLRQVRIQRITEIAIEQEGILSQEETRSSKSYKQRNRYRNITTKIPNH